MVWSSSDRKRAIARLAALLVFSFVPRIGQTNEPTTAEKDEAKELFAEGLELRAKGDRRGALAKFEAAFGLVPSPITALEVGRSHEILGELVEAHRALLRAENLPVKPTESAQARKAREDSADLRSKLEARIPTIAIKVRGLDASDGVAVSIDGGAITEPTGTVVRVNPGRHIVVAAPIGRSSKRVELVVAEGTARDVVFDFSITSSRTIVAASLGAIGIAGIALGSVFALSSSSTWSDAKTKCPEGRCATASDLDEWHSLRDRAAWKADFATGAFVVGAVALGGGAVLWLTSPSSTTTSSPQLSGGFSPVGVWVRGVF